MLTNVIKKRRLASSLFTLTMCLSYWSIPVMATEPLPAAQGRVVLTVTGNISLTNTLDPVGNNSEPRVEFDLALLDSLPQHEFSTTTPWTDGRHHFRGVLLQELLQRVGAKGTQVRAVALNAYHNDIDSSRPELARLLLVTHFDGEPMKIRDKGPVWLMLPLSEDKELDKKRYHELLIWQLKALHVRPCENL